MSKKENNTPNDKVPPALDSHWLDRHDHANRRHFGRSPSRRERSREQAIKDWFGEEAGALEIVAHQRPACHISQPLDDVLKMVGLGEHVLMDELRTAWSTLFGPDIGRQTCPAARHGDCLLIEVANAAWLYQLNNYLPEFTAKISEFTKGRIRRVRLVPRGRRGGQ